MIRVCADLGLEAGRVEGRSGVWFPADPIGPDSRFRPERKVAQIGIRVARGVTMHGFALNCDPDMRAFGSIVPCGITDAGVTSLSAELGRDVPVVEVIDDVERALRRALAFGPERTASPDGPARAGVRSGAEAAQRR